MRATRRVIAAKYNHLYKKVDFARCLYCGQDMDCLDHVPALTWMDSMGSSYFTKKGIELLLIPACNECNQALGSVGLFKFSERCAFVAGYLRDKYKALLAVNGDRAKWVQLRITFANCASPMSLAVLDDNDVSSVQVFVVRKKKTVSATELARKKAISEKRAAESKKLAAESREWYLKLPEREAAAKAEKLAKQKATKAANAALRRASNKLEEAKDAYYLKLSQRKQK